MMEILIVAVGGCIGAVGRYLVSGWSAEKWGVALPYGTLLVNLIGCFIIGLFMTLTVDRVNLSPYWRLFIAVGFLGGLTTFSSFGYETLKLLQDCNFIAALGNISFNVIGGLLAAWLGIGLAKLIN